MGIAVLIRTTRAFSIKLFQFPLTDVVPFPSAPSNLGFDATKKQFDNFFSPVCISTYRSQNNEIPWNLECNCCWCIYPSWLRCDPIKTIGPERERGNKKEREREGGLGVHNGLSKLEDSEPVATPTAAKLWESSAYLNYFYSALLVFDYSDRIQR